MLISQLSVAQWDLFKDSTYAGVYFNRLTSHANRLVCTGRDMRKEWPKLKCENDVNVFHAVLAESANDRCNNYIYIYALAIKETM